MHLYTKGTATYTVCKFTQNSARRDRCVCISFDERLTLIQLIQLLLSNSNILHVKLLSFFLTDFLSSIRFKYSFQEFVWLHSESLWLHDERKFPQVFTTVQWPCSRLLHITYISSSLKTFTRINWTLKRCWKEHNITHLARDLALPSGGVSMGGFKQYMW
jgi:hypothetical protein